jgi:hypothetical protein
VQDRVDLRFADAFNGKEITPEAASLLEATSNIIMLGTSASGKTRTIFDVARKAFMIYVACSVDSVARVDRAPSDVETTGDKVFPLLCGALRTNFEKTWRRDPENTTAEADRLILADICSRVLFAARVFQQHPGITHEQFLLLQLNRGRTIIQAYWWAVLKEAMTDIEDVLHIASTKVVSKKDIRFAIDEAQMAASMFTSGPYFYFKHKVESKGACGLLYQYCELITRHTSMTQVIVAGTALTAETAAQLPSNLGKEFRQPIVFPVLTEEGVCKRLARVLDTTDMDWNQVTRLDHLVGRCRWCATVVQALTSQAEKCVNPHQKAQILDECIRTCIGAVVETMVGKLNTHLKKYPDKILERLFVVLKLFAKPSEGLNLLFDARSLETMLKNGLGQLLGKTEEKILVSLDDYVTRTVVHRIGETARWSATDVIANEIINTYTTQTRASLGISFQMLVAAALCEFEGTIAELLQDVIHCDHFDENMDVLPDWATQASLSAERYVQCGSIVEVTNRLYSKGNLELDTLIQPDDRMRPDLVGILTGGQHGPSFALAVSAKVRMNPLSGKERTDDLASTCLNQAYLPKPSARAPGIVYKADSNWFGVYDKIQECTSKRCLRLHVVLGGYSHYKEVVPECDEGVSGKRLKTVHVDGDTIRIIIDKENFRALFRSELAQSVINKLMAKENSL